MPKKILRFIFLFLIFYFMCIAIWTQTVSETLITQAKKNITISLADIPKATQDIILIVEDPNFYYHKGIDPFTPGQGVTTITQSLARDIYLDQKINGFARIPQNVYSIFFKYFKKIDLGRDLMAVLLHLKMTKETQFELFLSTVYMGEQDNKAIIGFENAAKTYFNKNITNLSHDEVIVLAAMIKGPNKYHPFQNKVNLTERTDRIKKLIKKECKPKNVFDSNFEGCK